MLGNSGEDVQNGVESVAVGRELEVSGVGYSRSGRQIGVSWASPQTQTLKHALLHPFWALSCLFVFSPLSSL